MNTQKLDEVKRTLQRLQRIATEPEDDDDFAEASPADFGAKSDTSPVSRPKTEAPITVSAKSVLGSRSSTIGFIAIACVSVIGVASWAFVEANVKPVPEPVETAKLTVEPAVTLETTAATGTPEVSTDAQQLIETGKVKEARRRLIPVARRSPEAALALARSYDPNYLNLIPEADAQADPKEAERWYRIWWNVAAERGLALDAGRLDRIINAMH